MLGMVPSASSCQYTRDRLSKYYFNNLVYLDRREYFTTKTRWRRLYSRAGPIKTPHLTPHYIAGSLPSPPTLYIYCRGVKEVWLKSPRILVEELDLWAEAA